MYRVIIHVVCVLGTRVNQTSEWANTYRQRYKSWVAKKRQAANNEKLIHGMMMIVKHTHTHQQSYINNKFLYRFVWWCSNNEMEKKGSGAEIRTDAIRFESCWWNIIKPIKNSVDNLGKKWRWNSYGLNSNSMPTHMRSRFFKSKSIVHNRMRGHLCSRSDNYHSKTNNV